MEYKQRVVDTFRSGKYRQCYYKMFGPDNTNCALGVAFNILSSEEYDDLRKSGLFNVLIKKNDKEKLTFMEIANWLENDVWDMKKKKKSWLKKVLEL